MFFKCFPIFLMTSLLSIATIAVAKPSPTAADEKLAGLEHSFNGKIGVYAIDTNNGNIIAHRADERFPFQSTFKTIAAGALLYQAKTDDDLLNERITYSQKDLVGWTPITKQHVKDGMTLEELAEAAVSYSDNGAVNLIMENLGGPEAITRFANAIGNASFNVTNYEVNLNSNPYDTSDTSTPKDMAISLQKLTLDDVLSPENKQKLTTWLTNNTTGNQRIRAGVPIGWTVADKTGSGDYGVANDIALAWSPFCKPIVISIYTNQTDSDAKNRDDIIAQTTEIVFAELAKSNQCMSKSVMMS